MRDADAAKTAAASPIRKNTVPLLFSPISAKIEDSASDKPASFKKKPAIAAAIAKNPVNKNSNTVIAAAFATIRLPVPIPKSFSFSCLERLSSAKRRPAGIPDSSRKNTAAAAI